MKQYDTANIEGWFVFVILWGFLWILLGFVWLVVLLFVFCFVLLLGAHAKKPTNLTKNNPTSTRIRLTALPV